MKRQRTVTTRTAPYFKRVGPVSVRKPTVRLPAVAMPEKKEIDIPSAVSTLDTPIPLCLPVQGIADNQRIGNKITICNVNVRTQLAQAATPATTIRVTVFVDKQTNGAAPVLADIFQAGYLGYQNPDNAGRFQILHDEFVDMGFFTASTTFSQKVVKVSKKNLNIPMMFTGATGTIAACKTTQVYILTQANAVGATSIFSSRIKYYDA